MIPRDWKHEARNPRFWFAVALAILSGCASACGGEAFPPLDAAGDASPDAELCVCTECGDNVKLPCDGGEQ